MIVSTQEPWGEVERLLRQYREGKGDFTRTFDLVDEICRMTHWPELFAACELAEQVGFFEIRHELKVGDHVIVVLLPTEESSRSFVSSFADLTKLVGIAMGKLRQ